MIILARVYGHRKRGNECSILVDRIWPRGVRKATLDISAWHKELAPSSTKDVV